MIGKFQLYALVLSVGAINAMTRPILVAVEEQGIGVASQGFGISFVIWASLAWATYSLFSCSNRQLTISDKFSAGIVLLALMYPVATVSWLITGLAALYWRSEINSNQLVRSALAVFAFVAFRDPLASVALKLLATPLLNGDAILTANVMSVLGGNISRTGNLITNSEGHQLMILTGCTSYTNLSIALLAWFSWTQASVGAVISRHWVAAGLVVVTIVAINITRLALMGVGPDFYRFIHDGAGTVIVEAFMILATLFIANWGCRYGLSYRRSLAYV
jgi:hypothetical protein